MKKVLKLSLLIIPILFFTQTAHAASTYYVSASAPNDNGLGTQAQPFKTIQHAADIVNPGDTVLVNDGIYTSVSGTPCDDDRAVVCLHRGGTGGNWITFKSINRGGAKLSGQNHNVAYGVRTVGSDSSFIEFNGFEIYDTHGDGFILNVPGESDFRIISNHIHSIGGVCVPVFDSVGISAVYTIYQRTYLGGNIIHDVGRLQNGENGCSTTDIGHNHDHGVYANNTAPSGANPSGSWGATDLTIVNNVFYDFPQGWPVAPGPGAVTNMTVANNTFSGANPTQVGQILFFNTDTVTNLQIKNNIFNAPRGAGINYYHGNYTNSTVQNNLAFGANLDDRTSPEVGNLSGITTSGNKTGDPMFVDFGAGNFRLSSANSPAVNAGVTTAYTTDLTGAARTGAFDMGAYEFGGTVIPAAISVSPATISPGSSANVAWSNIPNPTSLDWVGLYKAGVDNTTFTDWIYVSCSRTQGAALATGSCPFLIPANTLPGTYEFRLFPDYSFNAIATSQPITITSGATPLVGDLNVDHIVNAVDWSLMNAKWFSNDTNTDLNHDGVVNAIDFSLLNVNWLKTW